MHDSRSDGRGATHVRDTERGKVVTLAVLRTAHLLAGAPIAAQGRWYVRALLGRSA